MSSSDALMFVCVFSAAIASIVVPYALGRRSYRNRLQAETRDGGLSPHPIEVRPSGRPPGLSRHRGVIQHVAAPIQTFVGGKPCAAWRIEGDGREPRMSLAEATPFELLRGDGRVVLVDPTSFRLDMPMRWSMPGDAELDHRQRAVLQRYGLGHIRRACVAEAFIQQGERVEVEGVLTARGDRDVVVGPLVIRPAPGAPAGEENL